MLTSPARLCRPCRLAGPAHAAATAGFSIQLGEIPRETDCPLEGNGFEISVPRCLATANSVGAFISAVSGSSSDRRSTTIGMPRLATARMTDAPLDRSQLGRTHETVAYLARN